MKIKKLVAVLLAAALLTAAFALPSVSAHETGASAAGDIDYEENPTGHCTEEDSFVSFEAESNYANGDSIFAEKWSDQPWITLFSPEDLNIVSFDFTAKAEREDYWDEVWIQETKAFAPETQFKKTNVNEIAGSFKCAKTPCTVKKDEPLFQTTLDGEGGGTITITLDVKNLIVRTGDGDKVLVRNSEVLDTPLDIKLGDANLDGVVNINDASFVQRYLADYKNQDGNPVIDVSDPLALYAADVNDDGRITIKDVTAIQSYLADFLESFI